MLIKVLENKRNRLLFYILVYTLVFAALGGALQLYVSSQGKTLIEVYDGFEIRYPSAEYARQSIIDFLSGNGIRQWDWTIGYGANPLFDLTGLAELNDPFYILLTLFGEVTPAIFVLLTFIRLYVAGLAFLFYCRVRGFKFLPGLTACVVYIYCTFTLSFVIKHPVFALALIAMPIIWAGIEHALAGKRAYVLSWGVFFGAATCLFFFYMIVLLSVLYALARFVQIGRQPWFKNLGKAIGRILAYSLLGVLMSAVLLIPQAMGLFTSSRSAVNNYMPYLQPFGLSYIQNKYKALLSSAMAALQFVPLLIIVPLTTLVSRRNIKHHKDDLILIAAMVIMGASSVILSVLSGFAKPSYRWWIFGIFILPVACANLLSRRDSFTLPEIALVGIGVVGCYRLSITHGNPPFPRRISFLLALIVMAMLFGQWLLRYWLTKKGKDKPRLLPAAMRAGFALAAIASVVSYGVYVYTPVGQNYITDMVPIGEAATAYKKDNPRNSIYTDIDDGSFYRVDTQYAPTVPSTYDFVRDNSSLALGYNGVRTSKSVTDAGVFRFYQDNHIRNMYNGCEVGSLDERSALLSLMGVKYYAAEEGNEIPIPYGFEQMQADESGVSLWRNKYDLGIGYVVEGYMLRQDADAMNPVARQFAQLQSVVLERQPDNATPRLLPDVPIEILDYTIESEQGLDIGKVSARANGNMLTATLSFQPVKNKELYVYMPNFTYEPDDAGEYYPLIDFSAGGTKKATAYRPAKHLYYTDIQPDMIHMGYHSQAVDSLEMYFNVPGGLSYDALQLISADMAGYDDTMQRLQRRKLQNVVVGEDTVSGTAISEGEGLLFLSVPYSMGWQAEVNGEKVEILKANSGFCALPLQQGSNEIYMEYKTPYFGWALLLSGLGFAGIIALYITGRRRSEPTALPADDPGQSQGTSPTN